MQHMMCTSYSHALLVRYTFNNFNISLIFKFQDHTITEILNVVLYTHFRNCALPPSGPDRAQRQQSNLITPPNVWHKNQDRIKNVDF